MASAHGARRDEYYWLRDDTRTDPEVLAHLEAENAYTEARLEHTKGAREALFEEIKDRIAQDDSTVPVRRGGFWYYTRFEPGREYPIHARRKRSLEAPEEILIDVNALAEDLGGGYVAVGDYDVSPDGGILAYTLDTVGRRQHTLKIRRLDSDDDCAEALIPNVESFAWAADSKTLLYVEKDPVTLLGVRLRRHALGSLPDSDPVVYEEQDRSFYMYVDRSRSGRFLFLYLQSTVATEQWAFDADNLDLGPRVIVPREREHEYVAEDAGDRWILSTNWQARNFRIVEAPMTTVADRTTWRDLVAHRDDALIHGFQVFAGHLAVSERSGGLRRIRLHRWRDGEQSLVAFDEPAYAAELGQNPEQESTLLRFRYSSLTTPETVYDLDLETGERELRKRDQVLGRFDPANYRSEFLFATARDGAMVPVSLVYRKDLFPSGEKPQPAPLYQTGYGAYGISSDPVFNARRLSLLDRGFVCAIAHVRGGQEMGRGWYEDGKLLRKMNTFHDFIDVTEHLIREGYAAPGQIVAAGGSAGGLLMGVVANLRPELYRVITARVPFVDVVTTMLDESIPLTTNEFDEWGNPQDKVFYDYMLSYSPYDQVSIQEYPAMLVTTGLWDSQVQYFEPAKWVARLRERNRGDRPVLLHVHMDAGHGGRSGRFHQLREVALEYAFVLDQLGIPLPG